MVQLCSEEMFAVKHLFLGVCLMAISFQFTEEQHRFGVVLGSKLAEVYVLWW